MHGAQAEREDTLRSGVNSAAVQYAMSRQSPVRGRQEY